MTGVQIRFRARDAMAKFSCVPLKIDGVMLVRAQKFGDARGYFMESFSRRDFTGLGIDCEFVQDNQSLSAQRGTVRGLHFQIPPELQAKLVRVSKGSIYDVAVDIRRGSPTFGRCCATTLTAQSGEQLFIPRGFAHGFCTLEPNTEVVYKVDGYYSPACDAGIIWNDPDIGIKWPVAPSEAILSARDAKLPRLADFNSPFTY